MAKLSECCGVSTYDAFRKGKRYLMCSKCKTETTVQKRIVLRGIWKDPHKGLR